jgi:uncharacterized protein (TIGR01777 family)
VKVVVAGGTGALGVPLCDHLAERGHEVVVLTRRPRHDVHRHVEWDGETVGPWATELAGAAVVNLAGEIVDRRPTTEGITLLRDSRVAPTRALAQAAAALDAPVPVWLQASTLALHGDAGETEVDEDTPAADGPPQMAGVARAWEAAAAGVHAERTVLLRTSIVLEADTPALDRLTDLVRRGLGGRVGSGRQWFSWIHVEDWLAVVTWALTGADVDGPLVVSSPGPVRNAELMATLRAVLGKRVGLPAPAPLVRVGARVLQTDPALALTGRRAVPRRLLAEGVPFRFPELEPALRDLLDQPRGA